MKYVILAEVNDPKEVKRFVEVGRFRDLGDARWLYGNRYPDALLLEKTRSGQYKAVDPVNAPTTARPMREWVEWLENFS